MASRLDRPRFFEGQYLGAADLEAIVGYARDLSREHLLAAHAWGIAVGLQLVDTPAAGGGADYFILPGLAWDGYGRAVLVLSPTQVPASLFSGLADGDQMVWLRYDETPFNGLREGFGSCGVNEAFARIRESFAPEAGPFIRVAERQGGVSVAGVPTPDARNAPLLFDAAAPIVGDGSIPYQIFPDETSRWLIPVGVATWRNGAPGTLMPRSPASLMQSRVVRQMAGSVAESLFAADGVIRLRDRFTSLKAGQTADDAMSAQAIQTSDLLNAPDPDDSTKTLARLVNRELVWVEGNLRATGQARRAVSANNPAGGQDFQIVIGDKADGKDRLAVGTATAYGPLTERFIVRTDGVVAAGLSIPIDLKTTHALVSRPDGVTAALAASPGKVAKLAYQTLPGLADAAHMAYDDGPKKLRLGVGADLANFTTWTQGGNVGIRTDVPDTAHADANDLVARSADNSGITLLGPVDSLGSLHFADGLGTIDEQRAGFIRYNHQTNRLQLGTLNALRATIDNAGNVGLGTDAPAARVDIREGAAALKLTGNAVQAENGGAPARLDLQSNGGGVRVNGGTADANRFALTADGRLGIGTDAPFSPITVRKNEPELFLDVVGGGTAARVIFAVAAGVQSEMTYSVADQALLLSTSGTRTATLRNDRLGVNLGAAMPATNLHVRGNIAGSAAALGNHVALIENEGGANGDVLALRMTAAIADGSCNFITFFDQTGAIGRIERGTLAEIGVGDINRNQEQAGTFLRLVSGGADFAECLPRARDVAPIGPGRIVGVKGGVVSLCTGGADSVLVTTDHAVVVGNAPADAAEAMETVALIGQVTLPVHGPAAAGDFILPSGADDGAGRAVPPDRLTVAAAGQVIGRAWSDKTGEALDSVRVAVGMQGADALGALSAALTAQQAAIAELQAKLATLLEKAD